MSKKSKCSLLVGPIHYLKDENINDIKENLMKWYLLNKRTLPWRSIAALEKDTNIRAYAVWVSEIMLQQTQVATVINYFNEWMNKWPTVHHLAEATLEEINKVWAGLGYYSRAKRLHEGAIKILKNFKGEFPQSRDNLQKLPGVGRYTASAIASIAMKEPVGVVDGNVLRVISRFCAIGSDISSQAVTEEIWKRADQLAKTNEPGDFNQAIMELGATVCTPKNPSCGMCPLKEQCIGLAISNRMAHHSSVASTISKEEKTKEALIDIECGLLANLWEFASVSLPEDEKMDHEHSAKEALKVQIKDQLGLPKEVTKNLSVVGDVVHIFSHIHQTYYIYKSDNNGPVNIVMLDNYQGLRWMTEEDFLTCATSTAMKKVFRAYKSSLCNGKITEKENKKRTASSQRRNIDKKQRKLSQFFSSGK